MDENIGTHQYNMRSTRVLICSDHISMIKKSPIDDIYCSDPIAENWGGVLSFVIIVGYHRTLWIDIHKNIIIGFRKHDIIPPMARNLHLGDPRTINKFNDTLHKRSVKHDIYQKIHYIHNRYIYPLPTHLVRDFERVD